MELTGMAKHDSYCRTEGAYIIGYKSDKSDVDHT